MVSLQSFHPNFQPTESSTPSSRLSFSIEFIEETKIISPSRRSQMEKASNATDFEFLSNGSSTTTKMSTADELFFEGRILPFRQTQHKDEPKEKNSNVNKDEKAATIEMGSSFSWFSEEGPSPRPPNCTELWKELVRLKKKQSPSSTSMIEENEGSGKREDQVKRVKKGSERKRLANVRVRPVCNVPQCQQAKSNSAGPLFFAVNKEDEKGEKKKKQKGKSLLGSLKKQQ